MWLLFLLLPAGAGAATTTPTTTSTSTVPVPALGLLLLLPRLLLLLLLLLLLWLQQQQQQLLLLLLLLLLAQKSPRQCSRAFGTRSRSPAAWRGRGGLRSISASPRIPHNLEDSVVSYGVFWVSRFTLRFHCRGFSTQGLVGRSLFLRKSI